MLQHNQPTIQTNILEVRDRIMAWLMQENWRIGQLTAPDAQWILTAEDPASRKIVIGQKAGTTDQIVIQGGVGVVDPVRNQINALSRIERQKFIIEMGLQLMQVGVEYAGLDEEPIGNITVAQRIYYDGLTKDAFLQRVSLVRNGVQVVLFNIAKRFGQEPPPQDRIGFRTPNP